LSARARKDKNRLERERGGTWLRGPRADALGSALCVEIKQTPRQLGRKELDSREKQTPINLTAYQFQAQGGRRTAVGGKNSKV
jgi:hypothetical protein